MQNIFLFLKVWWRGEYTPPEDRSDKNLMFLTGSHEKHWSSLAAHKLLDFFINNLKFLISTIIAIVGLFLSFR